MQYFPHSMYGFVAFCLAANLYAKDLTFPTVDCVITPSKVIEISAAAPGVVETLYVDRAQPVSKGQLLGVLRADVEKASVQLAQARTEMTAELSAEQVNLKYDRIQSSRVNLLGEKKLASSQNLDEAARIKQVTYWRLKQAEEALQLRELELVRSQAQLEEKKVYSTINGVVAERYKNEGEYVEEQPLFRLVQLNPLFVETVFPMEHYSQIRKGMTATIFPEIDQEKGYPVTVDLVDPIGDAASGTFGVRLLLGNEDYQLPAGLKCFLQLDELQAQTKTQSSEPVSGLSTDQSKNMVLDVTEEASPSSVVTSVNDQERFSAEANNESLSNESMPEALRQDASVKVDRIATTENKSTGVYEPAKSELQHQRLGPYTSQSQLLQVTRILGEQDVHYTVEKTDKTENIGYMVVSSDRYSQSPTVLLKQFTQAGVKGMGRLPKSSYGGRISFGAYNGPIQAEARKVSLAKLGINAEVVSRSKRITTFWVEVERITPSLLESLIKKLPVVS